MMHKLPPKLRALSPSIYHFSKNLSISAISDACLSVEVKERSRLCFMCRILFKANKSIYFEIARKFHVVKEYLCPKCAIEILETRKTSTEFLITQMGEAKLLTDSIVIDGSFNLSELLDAYKRLPSTRICRRVESLLILGEQRPAEISHALLMRLFTLPPTIALPFLMHCRDSLKGTLRNKLILRVLRKLSRRTDVTKRELHIPGITNRVLTKLKPTSLLRVLQFLHKDSFAEDPKTVIFPFLVGSYPEQTKSMAQKVLAKLTLKRPGQV